MQDPAPHLVDIPKVAEMLSVSPYAVRGLIRRREIPFVKLQDSKRGRIRFDVAELRDWIDARRRPALDIDAARSWLREHGDQVEINDPVALERAAAVVRKAQAAQERARGAAS